LSDQFVALPDDKWHIIYSGDQADADLFHTSFESYTGWHVDGLELAADLLLSPIQIQALPDIPRFRVEVDAPATSKSVTFTIAGYRDLLSFVDEQAAGHKAKPGQAQVTPLPELMSMELAGSEFRLSMNGAAHYTKGNPYATIGTGNHEPEPFERELTRSNMTAIARTLLDYEVEAQGSFIDTEDLIDACLRLQADLDGDLVTITIPTRSEQVRNSFTVELEAA
jgi:hypothetical protein